MTQEVTRAYMELQGVSRTYKGLQGDTRGYRGLQGITETSFVARTSLDTLSWCIFYNNQS